MNEYEPSVSIKLAKYLREYGFNWPCRDYWTLTEFGYELVMTEKFQTFDTMYTEEYLCPTLSHVHQWLREVKGLYVDVWLCAAGWSWNIEKCSTPENMGTFVTKHDEESGDDPNSGLFTSYENALEDGIVHALNLKPTEYE